MSTQNIMSSADQHNKNMKIKYITRDNYEAPLFRNICNFETSGLSYGANGQLTKQKIKTSTTYTKNGKHSVKDEELNDEFDTKYFPNLTAKQSSNVFTEQETNEDEMDAYRCGKIGKNNVKHDDYVNCREKSRYIEYSYVPNGSMQSGGFGNLNRFSDLKQGIQTRSKHDTVSDTIIDDYTFHHTFRNYQTPILGSNPLPENTRHANKKYIN